MLKAVFEGKLNPFLKAPSTDLNAGTLVKLASGGTFAVAVAGDEPYGVLAQDVRSRSVDNFKLDSVTHKAFYGEKAGIYFEGGVYYTDNTAVAVNEGDKLYVGANGQFTKTVPGTGFTGYVAIAEQTATAGTKVRIRFVK
jgi:hypothetical protein